MLGSDSIAENPIGSSPEAVTQEYIDSAENTVQLSAVVESVLKEKALNLGPRPKQIRQLDNQEVLVESGRPLGLSKSKMDWVDQNVDEIVLPSTIGGRLTWDPNNPEGYGDSGTISTLYYTPFTHNLISLYDGSNWNYHEIPDGGVSDDLSSAIDVDSNSLVVDTNYDVFIWDNSGVLTFEYAAWSNSGAGTSARQVTYDLELQDGVWVRSSDKTNRYLGTFRTGPSTAFPFVIQEDPNSDGVFLYLWNAHNKIHLPANITSVGGDSQTSAISLAPWDDDASPDHRMRFVVGLDEHIRCNVSYQAQQGFSNTPVNVSPEIAIGYNGSTESNRSISSTDHCRLSDNSQSIMLYGLLSVYAFGYNFVEPLHEWDSAGTAGVIAASNSSVNMVIAR